MDETGEAEVTLPLRLPPLWILAVGDMCVIDASALIKSLCDATSVLCVCLFALESHICA